MNIAIGSLVTAPFTGTAFKLPSSQATVIDKTENGLYQIKFSTGQTALLSIDSIKTKVGDTLILRNSANGMVSVQIQPSLKQNLEDMAILQGLPKSPQDVAKILGDIATSIESNPLSDSNRAPLNKIIEQISQRFSSQNPLVKVACSKVEAILVQNNEFEKTGLADTEMPKALRELAETLRNINLAEKSVKPISIPVAISTGMYGFTNVSGAGEWLSKVGIPQNFLEQNSTQSPVFVAVLDNPSQTGVMVKELKSQELLTQLKDFLQSTGHPLPKVPDMSAVLEDFLLKKGTLLCNEIPRVADWMNAQKDLENVNNLPKTMVSALSSQMHSFVEISGSSANDLLKTFPRSLTGITLDIDVLKVMAKASGVDAQMVSCVGNGLSLLDGDVSVPAIKSFFHNVFFKTNGEAANAHLNSDALVHNQLKALLRTASANNELNMPFVPLADISSRVASAFDSMTRIFEDLEATVLQGQKKSSDSHIIRVMQSVKEQIVDAVSAFTTKSVLPAGSTALESGAMHIRNGMYRLAEILTSIKNDCKNMFADSFKVNADPLGAAKMEVFTKEFETFKRLVMEAVLDTIVAKSGNHAKDFLATAIERQIQSVQNRLDSAQVSSRPLERLTGQEQFFSIPVKIDSESTYINVVLVNKDGDNGSNNHTSNSRYSISMNMALSAFGNVSANIEYAKKSASVGLSVSTLEGHDWLATHAHLLKNALSAAGLPNTPVTITLIRENVKKSDGEVLVNASENFGNRLDLMV